MPINEYDDIVANLSPEPETAGSVNEYDDIIRQESAAFGVSVQQGSAKTPEVSAQILDIHRKTGLPAAFVERNLDTIKQRTIRKEAEDYRRFNPITGAWIAESPYHFSLAQDDLKNLGAMERLTNIFKPVPALAFGNILEAASGAASLLQGIQPYAFIGYDEQAKKFRADAEAVRRQVTFEHPLERGSWSEATRNAFVSIYSQAPSYAIGLLTGGATIPLSVMGTQAGLQKSSELEAGGVSKPMAAVGGTISGLAEALTEMIPFGAAMDILKGNKAVGKSLIKGFISDQLGEQVATGVDTAIDKVSIRPDMGWDEYLQRIVDTAKTTTVQAGVMGGAAAGANRLMRPAEQKPPQTLKDVLLEVGKVAEASTLRQKSPETFQEVTKKLVKGGLENVYIPVESWDTYWQEQGADPSVMAQEMGITSDAYNEAVANKGTLQVAADAYVRKIAPTEHNTFFADEVKTRENAMNARELQKFLAAMEETPVDKVKEITDYVASQLEATGEMSKEDAQVQARALWGAPFKTLAERSGLDPLELFKQYNLSVTKGNVPRGTSGKRTLADFVRVRGGISAKDEFMKGEVRDRFSVKGGYNLVNNKTGVTLDLLTEAAWEAGYFQDRPSVSEFLDALRSDVDAKTGTGKAVTSAVDKQDMEAELDAEFAKHMGLEEGQSFEQGPSDEQIDAVFAKVAGDVWTGKNTTNNFIPLSRTPEVLKRLGAKNLPLTITPDVIRKARGKHGLQLEAIETLPARLRDPLMVFESNTVPNSFVVLTGSIHKGNPVVAAIHLEKNEGRLSVNRIASVHDKEIGEIRDFLEKKLLRYWDPEKAKGWLQSAGLQSFEPMPVEGTIPSNKNILSKADIVKSQEKAFEQSAFHGSPHKFDKFTLNHIGKGEGAQAYGWGLYFAENKKVAEFYRKGLSRNKFIDAARDSYDEFHDVDDAVNKLVNNPELTDAQKELVLALQEDDWLGFDYPHQAINAVFKEPGNFELSPRTRAAVELQGQLYEVELPNKSEYLDWDKPLSEQSEKVRAALSVARTDEFDLGEGTDVENGSTAYARISDALGSDQAASLYLKSIGIPGIKYLEGMSREKGEGHHNFVIFDEELIQIEEYYQKHGKSPRGRITFGPQGVNIALLKNANTSTFIHETGHFYLNMLKDLATMEGASQGIKADYQTIIDWLGVKEGESLTTAQHEQWARGFEAYLREGKAPSVALRSAFAKFREWLKQVYRSLKALNVQLTPEVTNVMDRLFASEEEIETARSEVHDAITDFIAEGKNIEDITMDDLNNVIVNESTKSIIRKMTGLKDTYAMIREDKALAAAWKKAEQASRVAFKAGKTEEAAAWKEKLTEVITKAKEKVAKIETEKQKMAKRRNQINAIIGYMGLTQGQAGKLMRHRDLALMSDFEFVKFKENLLIKAEEMHNTAFAKARVMEVIQRKRLERVENYRNALELPPISKMTVDQLNTFAEALEPFAEGDVFLTERELETVDRTDLTGIRTWREARERLAKETGASIKELESIKVGEFDEYRWDNALADQNPFYKMLVEETTRKLLTAEMRSHEVQNEVYELARKSAKSQGWSLVKTLIPQDKQIMAYMEAPADVKESIASGMTPEQLDLAHYMAEYFGRVLEYLIKTKSLTRGRENYFVHMRRAFLENLKEDGLLNAVKSVFKSYQDEEMVFNILDEDTGNILPMEKFFQYSMRRTGALEPTQNVVKAFLTYAKTFEKKVALDELIPKMDIYAQSLTPAQLTPRGLEVDRSIKKFVNKYINNKKGRHIRWISKQGGKVDLSIRASRTFTTLLDLALNIPVGLASFIGETGGNFVMLGAKDLAKGVARGHTEQGKKILEKYEAFTGRSAWEEFTVPGKEVTERLIEGMFGLFHQSAVIANKHYLLASLSRKEFDSGEISEERLAQMKIEMGRLRVVPGSQSLVGSTSAGSAAIQYKRWAVPITRTLPKDISTLVKDLRVKPFGEALTTREAREIYRVIGLSFTVLVVLGAGDEDDKSFVGKLNYKIRSEALSFMNGLDPKLWLSVPRILTFMAQLGNNLHSIFTLEEYKTKPGLKGVGGLEKQFTPAAVRGITSDDSKGDNR